MLRGHAGIHEGGVGDGVADEGPADVGEDVLVPVVLEIGEGNGVALLKVAETPLEGDVLEGAVPEVPPHDIRNEATHVGHAGAEVEVEEPVVIDVADVETHRTPRPHCRLHRINKGPVALVQVDPRQAFVLACAEGMQIKFPTSLLFRRSDDDDGREINRGKKNHEEKSQKTNKHEGRHPTLSAVRTKTRTKIRTTKIRTTKTRAARRPPFFARLCLPKHWFSPRRRSTISCSSHGSFLRRA
mmetsp:Transcript_1426/g.4870  ORF Transcript_1426/g.4870 Transcript_1426/m.4870 type:complete len:242 (-) Transcript_1426:1967-2692(-)